jgi:hypothetical protein
MPLFLDAVDGKTLAEKGHFSLNASNSVAIRFANTSQNASELGVFGRVERAGNSEFRVPVAERTTTLVSMLFEHLPNVEYGSVQRELS